MVVSGQGDKEAKGQIHDRLLVKMGRKEKLCRHCFFCHLHCLVVCVHFSLCVPRGRAACQTNPVWPGRRKQVERPNLTREMIRKALGRLYEKKDADKSVRHGNCLFFLSSFILFCQRAFTMPDYQCLIILTETFPIIYSDICGKFVKKLHRRLIDDKITCAQHCCCPGC